MISIAVSAKEPHLHVEQMFNGSYNANTSVSLNISKNQEKYFRGCTVYQNKKILKKLRNIECKKHVSQMSAVSQLCTKFGKDIRAA